MRYLKTTTYYLPLVTSVLIHRLNKVTANIYKNSKANLLNIMCIEIMRIKKTEQNKHYSLLNLS